MKKYTVFFDQVNRTNFQVKASGGMDAIKKAEKLYKRHFEIPPCYVQDDWLIESDGEDK